MLWLIIVQFLLIVVHEVYLIVIELVLLLERLVELVGIIQKLLEYVVGIVRVDIVGMGGVVSLNILVVTHLILS